MARRHAYDRLATGRYPVLAAYASLLTASADEADAVTHAALARVFGRLRPPADAAAAEAAVRREIVVQAARGRRAVATPPQSTATEASQTGDGAARESAAAFDRLRALDPVTRACVVLRHVDELPVAAVADRLRIAPEDVRGRLADAGDQMGGLVDIEATDDDIMIIDVPGARRHA